MEDNVGDIRYKTHTLQNSYSSTDEKLKSFEKYLEICGNLYQSKL